MRAVLLAILALGVGSLTFVGPASGLVLPPTTIDGPSSEVLELGGVAMAPDGTGGLVYTKLEGGVPHVFVSRYDGRRWSAPIRADADNPYDAGQPAIAAGSKGRLLVVWVTQVATVHEKIRRGLFSASLGPGASAFGPSLIVDPNVEGGAGATPSLAGAEVGKAIVAYRVVTEDFSVSKAGRTAVQLRPGDVMAEVRLARLSGGRWSRLGAINRDLAVSTRAPSMANRPQVGIGASGAAVVAWQEPEQSGTARIWMRRVAGNEPGPLLLASPASWEGHPIGDDADAFSLDVTAFDQARIAVRVDAARGSALGGPRIFLNTLGPSFLEGSGRPSGAVLADGGSPVPAPPGPPSVAASGDEGGTGSLRLAVAVGSELRQIGLGRDGAPTRLSFPPGPPVSPGGEVTVAADSGGGGSAAWSSVDASGRPVVAVRQDFASGAAQTGLLSGPEAGPISQLSAGHAGSGDALIAFRQGDAERAIVADRVAAPPASISVTTPEGWVRPRRAVVRWDAAGSAVGGVSYGVLLDGRMVRSGLSVKRLTPAPRLLGNGIRRVQVLATDRLGGQVLSSAAKLRVDARAPRVELGVRRARGVVSVRVRDPESGLRRHATAISFGDGDRERGRASVVHTYAHGGAYTVFVRGRDRVGNRVFRHYRVRVG